MGDFLNLLASELDLLASSSFVRVDVQGWILEKIGFRVVSIAIGMGRSRYQPGES